MQSLERESGEMVGSVACIQAVGGLVERKGDEDEPLPVRMKETVPSWVKPRLIREPVGLFREESASLNWISSLFGL